MAGVAGDNQPKTVASLLAGAARLVGIAAEGAALSLAIAIVGVLCLIFVAIWVGIVVLLIAAAVGAFFRDPERTAPGRDGVVISGADGKVCDIGEGPLPGSPAAESYRRVSVFMSPLDVHINRALVGGEVVAVVHTSGEFRAAFRDTASERNERNLMVFADGGGRRYAMVQVAGYLARRIICTLRAHDKIEPGERVGLIMFGSRVDHYMPAGYRVAVEIGERVRAGESIIGEIAK